MYLSNPLQFNRPLSVRRVLLCAVMPVGIREVEDVILRSQAARDEWDSVDLGYWREVDARYTFVGPMLRVLGWDVSDPKECDPEYPRGTGAVDYALFRSADVEKIGRFEVPHNISLRPRNSALSWVCL